MLPKFNTLLFHNALHNMPVATLFAKWSSDQYALA